MSRIFLALACILMFISCSKNVIKEEPNGEKLFDLASSEFYERIYPAWNNDSLKVEIISELLKKYPETEWHRTMYQYLANSLSGLKKYDDLDEVLKAFKTEFPDDYLPFTTSARYYYIDLKDTVTALECAQRGFERSENYPKLQYYPEMEWELEQRSALISSGSYLAEILIDKNEYDKGIETLDYIIRNNKLGVDDETTLCRVYYLMGKAYNLKADKEKALDYLSEAMTAGDSRNVWELSLTHYKEIAGLETDGEVLNRIRSEKNYDGISFNDVTDSFGLEGVKASRAAWGDYDNDGFQDLLLDGKRLFKNIGGESFYEISSLSFPSGMKAGGAVWGDFNNDGALDFVTKDPEAVWLNDKGVFVKVTGENAIPDNGFPTEGTGTADLNGDGFLDIYFAEYENSEGEYGTDRLYFGKGDGTFTDVTETSGIKPEDGKNMAGRGVNIGDFDNDGDMDIFVSNYRLTRNFLFINDGKGNFTETAVERGVSGNDTDGWYGHTIGSEWSDIDNDGDLDLISANLAHPRYIDFSDKTMIYKNSGAPDYTFNDIRRETGIRFEETHSEPALGDLDNDGYQDIYFTSVYEGRRSFLYRSRKAEKFDDVTFLSGTRKFNGWGVAFADIDNDGRLDMLTAGGQVKLFKNITPDPGNWLQVRVKTIGHSDGIGTRLRLYNENISLIREVQGGKGTTNQHSLVQHFGTGKEKENFTLEITFPSGEKRSVGIDRINEIITINE